MSFLITKVLLIIVAFVACHVCQVLPLLAGTFELGRSSATTTIEGSLIVRTLPGSDNIITAWLERNISDEGNDARVMASLISVKGDVSISFEVTNEAMKAANVNGSYSLTVVPQTDGEFSFIFASNETMQIRMYNSSGLPKFDLQSLNTPPCHHAVSALLSSNNIVYACYRIDVQRLFVSIINTTDVSQTIYNMVACPNVCVPQITTVGDSIALVTQTNKNLDESDINYHIFNSDLAILGVGTVYSSAISLAFTPSISAVGNDTVNVLFIHKVGNETHISQVAINIMASATYRELFQLTTSSWIVFDDELWKPFPTLASRSEVRPLRDTTTVWIGSYNTAFRSMEFNLIQLGLSEEELDLEPEIVASIWTKGAGRSVNDRYDLKVTLLDGAQQLLAEYETSGTTTGDWKQIIFNMTGYGVGLRYIAWNDETQDVEYWSGFYGAMADAPSIKVQLPTPNFTRQDMPILSPAISMGNAFDAAGNGILLLTGMESSSHNTFRLVPVKLMNGSLIIGSETTIQANNSLTFNEVHNSVSFWGDGGTAVGWIELVDNVQVIKLAIYYSNCGDGKTDRLEECDGGVNCHDNCSCPVGMITDNQNGCMSSLPPADNTVPLIVNPPTATPVNLLSPNSNSISGTVQIVPSSIIIGGIAVVLSLA